MNELDDLRRQIETLTRAQTSLRASEAHYRRVAEEALEGVRREAQMRQHLAAIVESSDDAIIATDLQGIITTWNRGAARLYGYAAGEVLGQSLSLLLPAGREYEENDNLARVARDEIIEHYETVRRRRDGTLVDVLLLVSPIRDAQQHIVGASKIARDLTERRRHEAVLRRTEEQLLQAQKMEAVGNLAGGVAHDFNNLLSVMLGCTALALEDLKEGDPLRVDLEQVEQAALKAGKLTRQLLAFSRQQILEPQVIDINRSVRGMQTMFSRLLGEDISISMLCDRRVGQIYADPGQVEQVLMNLVLNARDAMPTGGQLSIETSDVVLDAAYAELHHGVSPGRYVMLAVTDTGTGMDAATMAKVFEPFFSTKEKSKGTGLGLSTVYGIVRQSGGHIWLYSEPGQGTTFKVYFPRTDKSKDASVDAVAAVPTTLRGNETLLVVEDDDAVRTTVLTILRRQGYNVLEAANGGEALLICEQYGAKIHMLLTDVVMPRMNGRLLAERLTALRRDLRVLYMSGYTEDTIVHHGILDAGIAYLPKPLTPDALSRKVREVLDAPEKRV